MAGALSALCQAAVPEKRPYVTYDPAGSALAAWFAARHPPARGGVPLEVTLTTGAPN